MGFLRVILFSILLSLTFCSSSEGYNFIIGGKNGWSLHPSENYSNWANRLRFQVNDTLTFRYKKETDSVVVVAKNDYEKCNAAKPIQKMDGGDSVFKFDRSGPFYFITGNKSNCEHGQKLIIVVLAVRNISPPTPSVPVPTPAPGNIVPVPSPENTVPVPSPENIVPVPSPENIVPTPSPSSEGPAVSPAPVIPGPAVSPVPETFGPAANAPGIAPTPSPFGPGDAPADINLTPAPGPSKSFAQTISPATLVTAVLGVIVAAFITFA
ncbi:Early nodulin-like protein 2 [Heracleum sosnowskyi]|uniref:Early nodulin-like protein 2 n=1 Tax=Heracleum sosnowskyi TaxID=360622 RepID=A0AAD8JIJ5_9APIA|nr:Early nodulin-like protein 2 [Heracleum sosnowskyi]